MLKIWLLSWIFLFQYVHCYTFYEKPYRPELFQNEAELNVQGWASHNARDGHPQVNKKNESTNKGTAMLPSLLMINPRAKGVFENLNFFANPQFVPKQHKTGTHYIDPSRVRAIRRFPSRPKKREILMNEDVNLSLARILRDAVMDFKRRNYSNDSKKQHFNSSLSKSPFI